MSLRARYWYGYNGTGNVHIAASYNLLVGVSNPQNDCVGSTRICAIYAYSRFRTSTPPGLSTNINNYITSAQAGSNNFYPLVGPIVFLFKKDDQG